MQLVDTEYRLYSWMTWGRAHYDCYSLRGGCWSHPRALLDQKIQGQWLQMTSHLYSEFCSWSRLHIFLWRAEDNDWLYLSGCIPGTLSGQVIFMHGHHSLNLSDHLPLSISLRLNALTEPISCSQSKINWPKSVDRGKTQAYAVEVSKIVSPLLSTENQSISELDNHRQQSSAQGCLYVYLIVRRKPS